MLGCMDNNQITQLIIITVKYVIFKKRKIGVKMTKKIFTVKYERVESEWNDEKHFTFI